MSKKSATIEQPPPPTIRVESVTTDSLHMDPANARRHPERNLDAIKASLARFGQQTPIVVDSNGVVRKGNGTLQAAIALGWDRIDIVRTPLAGSEATAYAIADNRTGDLAEWDDAALAETLRALQSEDFDLSAVGYRDDEVDALIEGLARDAAGPTESAEDPGAQTDRAEELREKWGTERGQLWVIPSLTTSGREHRLLCGDSTNAEDVARVMGGEKASLCLTDPPYGVAEDYAAYEDTKASLADIAGNFLPLAMNAAAVVMLTPGNSNQRFYPHPDWTLAWLIPAGAGLGPWGFTCWQPVLAYGSDPYLAKGMGARPDCFSKTESAENSLSHPCPKPIGVWKWFLERGSVSEGDLIYEPFCGSGTTIVAAEQTGRICYGIELSPGYCGVILERLAGLGLTPCLAVSATGKGAA